MFVRRYDLGSVVLEEHDTHILTTYPVDGSTNTFIPPVQDPNFISAAHEMGYSDLMRYAVEHELTHHLVAFADGKERSSIIWDAAHYVPMSMDEPERAAEEHLVNRLQRYMNLGAADPWNCLEEVFENRLPKLASTVLAIARPWLHTPSLLS